MADLDFSSLMDASNIPAELIVNTKKNKYLDNKDQGLKFLAELVSIPKKPKNTDIMLNELSSFIEEDFLSIEKNDPCPHGAETFAKLLTTYDDLSDLVHFPDMENKYIVAVGGQFSAGKSKFMNSLIGIDDLLPEDTCPTTSIPTYILKGKKNGFYALNRYRNNVEIDADGLHAICHEFKKVYAVTFSHILRIITVEIKNFNHTNITYLDTPGYSKNDSIMNKNDNTDENVARDHLRNSDFLIWLIDVQNGTVPQTDIDFIRTLNLKQPILFIFNKADKKSEKQVLEIIETGKTDLTKNKIKYYDVIGYSSLEKKEFGTAGNRILEFLTKIESGSPGTDILRKFSDILDGYISHHNTELEFLKSGRDVINNITLDESLKGDRVKALENISRRYKNQRDLILSKKGEVEALSGKIITKVKDICTAADIRLIDKIDTFRLETANTVEEGNNPQTEFKTYCFDGILDNIKDRSKIDSMGSYTNINGKVTKVSPIGIKIDAGIGAGIIIMKQDVRKILNESAMFTEGQTVRVQITKGNCVRIEADFNI